MAEKYVHITARRRLIVNWQSEATRAIIPVAELIQDTTGFEFGYLEGLKTARQQGFAAFLAFPELERRYRSDTLFPFFRNRVLPATRPDYVDYLNALGLRVANASEIEVLGRSHGWRQTDKVETVLEPVRDPVTGSYVTHFLARGVRHVYGAERAILGLTVGTELGIELDRRNEHNPRARRLVIGAQFLGYVPDYLLNDIDALDAAGERLCCVVERVNPPPHPMHHRLLVRLSASWPEGFTPFSDPRLVPLVPRAA